MSLVTAAYSMNRNRWNCATMDSETRSSARSGKLRNTPQTYTHRAVQTHTDPHTTTHTHTSTHTHPHTTPTHTPTHTHTRTHTRLFLESSSNVKQRGIWLEMLTSRQHFQIYFCHLIILYIYYY